MGASWKRYNLPVRMNAVLGEMWRTRIPAIWCRQCGARTAECTCLLTATQQIAWRARFIFDPAQTRVPLCFLVVSCAFLRWCQVMTTLIPSFAAVIAALNISLGADVGGFFLETIAKELDAEVWGEARGTSGGGGGGGGAAGGSGVSGSSDRGRGGRGTGSNLLLLLAYLYNYGVAHCTLVYDIIGLLIDGTFCSIWFPVQHVLFVCSAHSSVYFCVADALWKLSRRTRAIWDRFSSILLSDPLPFVAWVRGKQTPPGACASAFS